MFWPRGKDRVKEAKIALLRELPVRCGNKKVHEAYVEAAFMCPACKEIADRQKAEQKEDQFAEKVARRVVEMLRNEK